MLLGLAVGVYVGLTMWAGTRTVHALPEFTTRTGEPCATCHVNPGGGGPRTLRGLLWAARGRPDEIPQLPGLLIAPGVTEGLEIYDIACAGCHGFQGEGLSAIQLVETGISEAAARSFIVRGIPKKGMPGFEGQLTEEQLDTLAEFVERLANGEVELLDRYPLPEPELRCASIVTDSSCGGE